MSLYAVGRRVSGSGRSACLGVLLLAAVGSSAHALTLTTDLKFHAGQFRFSTNAGFEVVLGGGMDVTDEPGAPQLPVQPVVIALPGRCRVTKVTFEVREWQPLGVKATPFPAQRQRVLVDTSDRDAFMAPNPSVYQSSAPYPAAPAVWTGTSHVRESTLVQVLACPVRFTGTRHLLEMCPLVRIVVEYEPGAPMDPPRTDALDYVIVTAAGYDTVFQRLADWKTQKGVMAAVRDIAWVVATYPGRDDAERLRNYVKNLPDSGVHYVLLGGDVDVVPHRVAYAMSCEWGARPLREDSLPCDFYFADLQGTWDANGNGTFGEVDDSVDLYADIAVGRAPVDAISEAQAFVRKVIDYEKASVVGYQDKALFFAEILWSDPYTDQGIHKNRMEQQSFPSGYGVTKLYQSLGNETREAVMAAMRENQNFLNHDGHGWIDVMSCGGGGPNRLRTADAETLTNSGCGVLYSIGCWTTAFDSNSIAEAFVTNPNGGTVATIGNSSYGWGSPGNPGFGYSDKFDNRFWHAVTQEGIYRVGDALDRAKAYYVPFSHDRNVYRWHQYELNLMGDPEMPVWTAQPRALTVDPPFSIGGGHGRYQVTVTDVGQPVPGALVCLMKDAESYDRGLTDDAGKVWLNATPETTGIFRLTVTAHNYIPVETLIPCGSGAYVNFAGWSVSDSAGNGDGVANPRETAVLPLWLANSGNQPSGAVAVTLRSANPHVQVLDSVVGCGPLSPGDSALIATGLRVAITSGAQDGEAIGFDLQVSDGCQVRMFRPVQLVGESRVRLERSWLSSPPLAPGQTGALRIRLQNRGHGWGHGTWCRLSALDTMFEEVLDSVYIGEIRPGGFGASEDSFTVRVAPECPPSYQGTLKLYVYTDDLSWAEGFSLIVGTTGFSDDMESGDAKWTHGGAGDQWHRTGYRTHSGGYAWYCGDDGTQRYQNRMDAWLTSEPFAVAQNCSLSFWRWFKVPNYGVDGIYVIVVREGSEDTLDFVGTGGALGDPLAGIESFWAQERYDLSWLEPGETVQVKLVFKSDTIDVDEGFYIDDVEVTGGGPPLVGVVAVEPAQPLASALSAFPNPFSHSVRLNYAVAPAQVGPSLDIYDASGRLVSELAVPGRGYGSVVWDAKDRSGRTLSAGTYFVRLRAGAESRLARVVLAR